MHDTPYLNGNVGPEVVSSMTRISTEIRHLLGDDLAIGIQILSAANIESLSVAQSSSADFIRVEGYVYSHIGDEGLIQSCAGKLLRHRKAIGADNILVWTDVKKKHSSHAITNDVSLIDTIKSAEFFHSDGIIVTGTSTGEPTDVADVEMAVKATGLPVLIGSGVTMRNAVDYKMANGFIIGSHFKKEGKWFNNIDENKLESFMESLNW
jgi:membrane complex biogenesis BtpA family protein